MQLIAKLYDTQDNMTAYIYQNAMRYSVRLFDNDSENFLPVARVYADLESALQYARELTPSSTVCHYPML